MFIERKDRNIPIYHQCELIGLARSNYYYKPRDNISDDLKMMRLIDEQHTRKPFYGIRKITAMLHLLKGMSIERQNQALKIS